MPTIDANGAPGTAAIGAGQVSESGPVTFPPIYYDAPVSQLVEVALGNSHTMTALITSGAPYFQVAGSTVTAAGPIPLPVPSGERPGGTLRQAKAKRDYSVRRRRGGPRVHRPDYGLGRGPNGRPAEGRTDHRHA